jgi:hypothetical protein
MKDFFHCKEKNTTKHPAKAAEEKGKENSKDPQRDLTKNLGRHFSFFCFFGTQRSNFTSRQVENYRAMPPT